MKYNLNWYQGQSLVSGNLYFAVTYPSRTSSPQTFKLTSPAAILGTQEILTNVRIYLDGPDASLILSWQSLAVTDNNNGGLEVSFDLGRNWVRMGNQLGNWQDSTTWIELPAEAMGTLGQDGIINPYDTASIMLRLVVPPTFNEYGVLSFNIGVDFDVI